MTNRTFELGVNLFGLTEPFAKDKAAALWQLQEIGFDCIEPMLILMKQDPDHKPPGDPPPQLWFPETISKEAALLRSLGLKVRSMHAAIRYREYPAAYIAEVLMKAYRETGACFYVVNCAYRTSEGAADWAGYLTEIQQHLTNPVRILAHNHNMEFHPTGDPDQPYMLDLFLEAAPEIGLELDYGWTWYAGLDFETVRKYNDRIVLVHLKDFRADIVHKVEKQAENDEFLPIGTGAVYNRDVLDNLKDLPQFAGLVILDQDYDPDIMHALATGADKVNFLRRKVNY